MSTVTISIPIDQESAQIYTHASTEKRKKIQLLFSLWLREFEESSLSSLMDKISDNAQDRGLTAKILESLLHDD